MSLRSDSPIADAVVSPTHRWRRRLLRALKWLVSATLIWWVLRRVDVAEVVALATAVDLRLLAAAFALLFVGVFISSLRWRLLLRAQGVEAPHAFLYSAFLVGVFFNNFFPSTVGGDAVRAYDSWRLGARRSAAVAVIFVDRFLGVIALTCFALAALPVAGNLTAGVPLLPLWIALGLGVVALIAVLIFAPPPRLLAAGEALFRRLPAFTQPAQRALGSGFGRFRGHRQALQGGLAWSLLLQVNVVLFYYVVAHALGLAVPLDDFFLIVPLSLFVMSLPITINAIGVRETVFVFFFAVLGIESAHAVAFAWVAYALMLLQGLVGGAIYVLRDNRIRYASAEGQSSPSLRYHAAVRARPSLNSTTGS